MATLSLSNNEFHQHYAGYSRLANIALSCEGIIHGGYCINAVKKFSIVNHSELQVAFKTFKHRDKFLDEITKMTLFKDVVNIPLYDVNENPYQVEINFSKYRVMAMIMETFTNPGIQLEFTIDIQVCELEPPFLYSIAYHDLIVMDSVGVRISNATGYNIQDKVKFETGILHLIENGKTLITLTPRDNRNEMTLYLRRIAQCINYQLYPMNVTWIKPSDPDIQVQSPCHFCTPAYKNYRPNTYLATNTYIWHHTCVSNFLTNTKLLLDDEGYYFLHPCKLKIYLLNKG